MRSNPAAKLNVGRSILEILINITNANSILMSHQKLNLI